MRECSTIFEFASTAGLRCEVPVVDRDLVLVHDYTRLDPAIVVRVLRQDVLDVRRFHDAVRLIA